MLWFCFFVMTAGLQQKNLLLGLEDKRTVSNSAVKSRGKSYRGMSLNPQIFSRQYGSKGESVVPAVDEAW